MPETTNNRSARKLSESIEGVDRRERDSFDKRIQKRLRKIEKNWEHFTAFYFGENAPATNNLLENYYSMSLKTHRKKQLRTDRGLRTS
jgi:hypothetical protein